MVTGEELGSQPLEITAISFSAGPLSDPEGPYNDLTILMGLTELESLTDTFDNNWSSSPIQVLSDPSYSITGVVTGSFFTFELDDPYYYDGTSNLLIELSWEGPLAPIGQGSIYTWSWVTTGTRMVTAGSSSASTGSTFEYCNNIRIDFFPQALEGSTFAGIKGSF